MLKIRKCTNINIPQLTTLKDPFHISVPFKSLSISVDEIRMINLFYLTYFAMVD